MPIASTSIRTWPSCAEGSGPSLYSMPSGPPLRSQTTACIKQPLLLLDQTGRTGLIFRHSTTWIAVVSAAPLTAALSSDVGDDHAHPFERAVRARHEIAHEARRRWAYSSAHS